MAGPSVTAERIQWAVDRLLECRSTSAVVSQLSEREGLSRRQAQRIVGRAHAVLVQDLEGAGVDRQQIVAQIEHGLMEALGKALASSQPAAVVGAARELRELLQLTNGSRPLQPDRQRWQRWS
jgi:predicted transcriptional regulator